ncbi:hypothetical protein BC834DRAFT_845591 [Gloeopeniophorella convolvens]|nr:hypothetical protein BC834DRAFT_845591 [Gloeopeniophorella convolvens]
MYYPPDSRMLFSTLDSPFRGTSEAAHSQTPGFNFRTPHETQTHYLASDSRGAGLDRLLSGVPSPFSAPPATLNFSPWTPSSVPSLRSDPAWAPGYAPTDVPWALYTTPARSHSLPATSNTRVPAAPLWTPSCQSLPPLTPDLPTPTDTSHPVSRSARKHLVERLISRNASPTVPLLPSLLLEDLLNVQGYQPPVQQVPMRMTLDERCASHIEQFRDATHHRGANLLLETLFKPSASERTKSLASAFYEANGVRDILRLWWSVPEAKSQIIEFLDEDSHAVELVEDKISSEMDVLTAKFRLEAASLEPSHLADFSLKDSVGAVIEEHAPNMHHLMLQALQTKRARKSNTSKNPDRVALVIICQIAKHRSQKAQLFALAHGITQWAARAPKQCIEICSKLGLSSEYSGLSDAHESLCRHSMAAARDAARGPHMFCYDNIHVATSNYVEQRPGARPKVTVGTTLILEAILDHQAIHLVEILLRFAPEFKTLAASYLESPLLKHPPRRAPPEGHHTVQHPLQTTTTNEASIEGNIEVFREAYETQLGMDAVCDLGQLAIPSINDQATNSNIRAAQARRKHDVTSLDRIDMVQLAPGLFHVLLNMSWSMLGLHRGNAEDYGSLESFISLLGKKRHASEHPDYHALKATENQVLFGLTLSMWKSKCAPGTLQEFANSAPDVKTPLTMAEEIFVQLSNGTDVADSAEGPTVDQTARSVRLMFRDLLHFYTLHEAVKSGDFGRVELFLGHLAIWFCGAGARNYCTEFLHLIQNLEKVWTPGFADVMRDNMLINMSGRSGHWTGVDENIEHVINTLKEIFSHHTANGSGWDSIRTVSPTVPILQKLLHSFRTALGVGYKGITHTKVDTSMHVYSVSVKVDEWALLIPTSSRHAPITKPTIDAFAVGISKLKGL